MTCYTVQDYGCIALPPDVQQMTGFYPGAIFEIQVSPDSSKLTLCLVERSPNDGPQVGAWCGPAATEGQL